MDIEEEEEYLRKRRAALYEKARAELKKAAEELERFGYRVEVHVYPKK
jgi:hypothetical protein